MFEQLWPTREVESQRISWVVCLLLHTLSTSSGEVSISSSFTTPLMRRRSRRLEKFTFSAPSIWPLQNGPLGRMSMSKRSRWKSERREASSRGVTGARERAQVPLCPILSRWCIGAYKPRVLISLRMAHGWPPDI